ncbi:MAG: pentapeptide repeat-containing protein [Oscillospiraceae bacterium]|jgi:uncharacterized protein YjbI with pentapeptide repeats|nr:pentapeptide repeat-containing protein [Oscillospiraceae bacterium]
MPDWLKETLEWVLKILGALSGVGGLAAVAALIYNGRKDKSNWDATQKRLDEEQHIKLEANYGERLRQAIEHLGNESDTIKQGACYELKRLAEDSERDRKSILEILTAYVREGIEECVQEPVYQNKELMFERKRPKTSVFVAAKVLTYLYYSFKLRADLHDFAVSCVDLAELELCGADLRGASLHDCILYKANFSGAWLHETWWNRSGICKANFSYANLSYTRFSDADLESSKFCSATLRGACFVDANLGYANLYGAVLMGTYLRSVEISGANLKGADFNGVNLCGIDFTSVDLSRAKLTNAHNLNTTKVDKWTTIDEHTEFSPGEREKFEARIAAAKATPTN